MAKLTDKQMKKYHDIMVAIFKYFDDNMKFYAEECDKNHIIKESDFCFTAYAISQIYGEKVYSGTLTGMVNHGYIGKKDREYNGQPITYISNNYSEKFIGMTAEEYCNKYLNK